MTMKHETESSENLTAVVGVVLSALSIFLFVWFIRSLPPSSENSSPTPEEATQYEEYESEQQLYENGAQEACIEQEERDIERYGARVTDTYNCTE